MYEESPFSEPKIWEVNAQLDLDFLKELLVFKDLCF